MAEIRIDLLDLIPNQLEIIFSAHPNLIATCRPGKYNGEQRSSILIRSLLSGAAYVDVEAETPQSWRRPIIAEAHRLNRKVIVSWHCFDATPDEGYLHRLIGEMFDTGADIAKIACMPDSARDCARIMGLYARYTNLVALSMGEMGRISRMAAPMLGAPFTFTSISGQETAPGQLDYCTMEQFLNIYLPLTE
ncbi:MAG: type I 3-dehydroquinate dehydratase [Bacteroidales bacterium]